MVGCVDHEQRASAAGADAARTIERGLGGRDGFGPDAAYPGAHEVTYAAIGGHLPDAMVVGVGDEKAAGGVEGDSHG
jgi:hypothetical protein